MADSLLRVEGLSKHFGGVTAVDGLDFELEQGEVLGLIGPNGAGKTTVINLLSGLLAPSAGRILMAGRDISRMPPERRVKAGLSRTFQLGKPLRGFTVLENVALGAMFGAEGLTLEHAKERARETLDRVGMGTEGEYPVEDLSVPDRKRLEVARVVAMRPQIMLLDEVMAGLNPREITGLIGLIRALNREGATILVVEHVMRAIMSLSTRVLVLHRGRMLACGPPAEIAGHEDVIRVYLGGRYAHKPTS